MDPMPVSSIQSTRQLSTMQDGSIIFATVPAIRDGKIVFVMFGGNKMSQPQTEREHPDHWYVDVVMLATKTSILVFLICLLSLAISYLANFHMIHPIVAIMIMIGSAGFYFMGRLSKKQHSDDVRHHGP
jgi:hypothetical protein